MFIGMVEIPFQKIVKTFPVPLRNLMVKEKYIGSSVSEILCYRQKDFSYFILEFKGDFIID